MFVKNINDCPEFTANDGCRIREWLHPKNNNIDLPYSVATATIGIGQQSYRHKLEQTEVYLITSGQGRMHIDAEELCVSAGDAVLIPSQATQWVENIGKELLHFIAIVNPPWSEEGDVRL